MKRLLLSVVVSVAGLTFAVAQTPSSLQGASDELTTNAKANGEELTSNDVSAVASPNEALPGFPVYVNTGNPEQDGANYKAAKEQWILDNPDLYYKHLADLRGEFYVLNSQLVADLPGFPAYINTGNPTSDRDNYDYASKIWIKDNMTLYQDYINSLQND